LARLLRCTEGRAYTLVLGLMVAVVITAFTVPAVLNHRPPVPARAIPFQDLSNGDSAAPLTISEAGYATATRGVPTVPAQDLPVGSVAGVVTQESFLRFSGQAQVLHLSVDTAASSGVETAHPVICPMETETWQPLRDAPITAAPPFDCASAVAGVRSPDGGWTFDLGRFTDRAGSRGFALVPMPAMPGGVADPDFSILFTH